MIQWFPGHMSKAVRLIEDNIKLVDAVIYVIDSRAVEACLNPAFDKLLTGKPTLFCFSKSDLVEQSDLKRWYADFDRRGLSYVTSVSVSGSDASKVMKALLELMRAKIERYKAKGVNAPIRSMVIGIPNSGKSTLINSLCGGKRTITGDRPGVTRSKQWLAVAPGIDMLDTPGTLWPKLENQEIAEHLAFIGSIRDEVLNTDEIALSLIKFLFEKHPDKLRARYNIETLADTPLGVYEQIALSRNYALRGAEIDYDRTGKAVLDDFRKTRFGKIMLELPEYQ
jgi:ribosome biogenesis GTP-binding protein YlqF